MTKKLLALACALSLSGSIVGMETETEKTITIMPNGGLLFNVPGRINRDYAYALIKKKIIKLKDIKRAIQSEITREQKKLEELNKQ